VTQLSGEHLSIPCLGTDTIAVLKQKIGQLEGSNPAQISILTADGTATLHDEAYLCECQLTDAFEVLMTVSSDQLHCGAQNTVALRCAISWAQHCGARIPTLSPDDAVALSGFRSSDYAVALHEKGNGSAARFMPWFCWLLLGCTGAGETALHRACRQQHPGIVRVLIYSGADMDAISWRSWGFVYWSLSIPSNFKICAEQSRHVSAMLGEWGRGQTEEDEAEEGPELDLLDIPRPRPAGNLSRWFEWPWLWRRRNTKVVDGTGNTGSETERSRASQAAEAASATMECELTSQHSTV
jgi:hypothetical protein